MRARLLLALLLPWLLRPASADSNCVVNFSHYDGGELHFASMRKEGIVGVIHEATYPPGITDPEYARRQGQATQAGLLWGAYHFGNSSDPVRQADNFVEVVGREARRGSQPTAGVLMVLDFERNTHYPGGSMTVPQAVTFLRRVRERTGQYPGVYSNENRVRALLGGPLPAGAEATLRDSWLWIANYHYKPVATAPWRNWTLWQYTGDGVCDLPRSSYPMGISNIRAAERNIYNGSRGDLERFWREHAWRP